MDLEKESTMIKVDTGKSQDLSELCARLLELQRQIKKCEDNIKICAMKNVCFLKTKFQI